jgi:uncharacterized repeat protein (TIGR01451 family)
MSGRRFSLRRERVRAASRFPRLEVLEERQLLATFVVTNAGDSADPNSGSLRRAIMDANAMPGADVITFNIGGSGLHSIAVDSALPTITDPVTIDGTTQPGYTGRPLIEINGTSAGSNANGLRINSASTVKGLAINRFSAAGIRLEVNGNTIQSSFIGTDATGTSARPNQGGGIVIDAASNNLIGGGTGLGNVISGNLGNGIAITGSGSTNNRIDGNLIGTDVNGVAAVPNTGDGVNIFAGNFNRIGGLNADERNVISGNLGRGVFLFASSSTVQNNYIGVGANGTTRLGNGSDGVSIFGSDRNVIGGTLSSNRNVISGNGGSGVAIFAANQNMIQGNYIGVGADATTAVGNQGAGVSVDSASGNQIGGTAAGAGNVVAFNGQTFASGGVAISGSQAAGNSILSNAIFANNGLGIDLAPSGVNPNDPGDADTGPNRLLNYPDLVLSKTGAGRTLVQGTFNSTPSTTFLIQFFSSPAADSSGFGEGQTLFGSASVTTDSAGNAAIDVTFQTPVQPGQFISAVATDSSGNSSEFSRSIPVAPGAVTDLAIRIREDIDPATLGDPLTYTLTITNNGPDPAANIQVTDNLPASVTFLNATTSPGGSVSQAGADVVATFPTLAAGATATVTIVVRPNQTGLITNRARVTSTDIDPDQTNNAVTETTTVNIPADLVLSIQADQTETTVGEDLVYVVLVVNEGPGAASNVVVTTDLPDDVTIVGYSTGQGTIQQFGNQLVTTIGTMPNGSPAAIRIVVTPNIAGTTSIDASVAATETDPDPLDNTATLLTPVNAAADLGLTLAASATTAFSGQELIYTINVANAGPSSATDVVVTQTIEGNPVFLDLSSTQGTISAANGVVTANLGDLDIEGSATVTVRILVPQIAGLLDSTATVSSPVLDRDSANNNVSVSLPVDPSDVSVGMVFDPSVGRLNQPLSVLIPVANAGPTTAGNTIANITLPEGVVLDDQTTSQGSITVVDERHLRADLGSLLPGGSALVRLQVRPAVAGNLTFVAVVGADNDVVTSNNQISRDVSVDPADLSVSLAGPTGNLAVGAPTAYTVSVTNRGPAPARNVNLVFAIPAGAQFVSMAAGDGLSALSRVDETVVGLVESLAPGATASYSVSISPTAVGTLTATATATAANVDTNLADNTSTIISDVLNLPGALQFAQATFESADNAGNAVIRVTRTGGTAGVLAVNYSATEGTAIAGKHFVPVSGTLIFQDGELSKTFTVPILDDGEVTGLKTVLLTLTDIGLGSVGPQFSATIEIAETDNDLTGPRAVDLSLQGRGATVTAIVLTFSEALDPAKASDPANFSLVGTGRGRAGGIIPVTPLYDDATRTVTLIPSRPLPGGSFYNLSINGSAPGGLTDRFGNLLDGDGDGRAGGNQVASFARGTNLSYLDRDGDQVSLRLTGSGLIEIQRGGNGEAQRVRLLGVRPRSILNGSVRRSGVGDGSASLGFVEGLGAFQGGARSRLTTPPFTALNQPVLDAAEIIVARAGRPALRRLVAARKG